MHIAYAVVRDEPPRVYLAEQLEVLHRVLAIEVVAATPGSALSDDVRDRIRAALLDERWADAVSEWMEHSQIAIDVYDGGIRLWSDSDLDAEETSLALQFRPLFRPGP